MKGDRLLGIAIGIVVLFLEANLWHSWHLTGGLLHWNLHALILAGALGGIAGSFWVVVLWPRLAQRAVGTLLAIRPRAKWLRWLLLTGWVVVFPYLTLYSPAREKLFSQTAWWWLYGIFSTGAAFLLASDRQDHPAFADFVKGSLLTGSVFAFLSAYVNVSSYPFSLSWSEGNWLWDYSLMFSRGRYLYPQTAPIFAYIDKGRQFLWGLVYLIPGVGIKSVRFWNAFLFTVPYLLFGWTVFWRPANRRRWAFWAGLWGFLFLRQGPIYTPLLLSAWVLVIADMISPWWIGGLLVAASAYYAAITRFTWVLAPTLWAILFVASKVQQASDWHVLWKKKGWLVGSAILGGIPSHAMSQFIQNGMVVMQRALGTKTVVKATPQPADLVARHPLIWSRLWPNATFPLGIVLGTLLATAPVACLWWIWRRRKTWHLHWSAEAVVGAILTVFLGIGIIVSLKIGGGNNLHNLDMFFLALLLITAAFWQEGGAEWLQKRAHTLWEQSALFSLVIVPMYFVFAAASPQHIPEKRWWEPALKAVQNSVQDAVTHKDEVLFLDQRQLLTFKFVREAPLVPDYEQMYMMDQAMANNVPYFAHYYHDLARHRFAVIISSILDTHYQPPGKHNFAAENNAWVRWVAIPTLCFYQRKSVFPAAGVEILVPREGTPDCQDVLPVPPAP